MNCELLLWALAYIAVCVLFDGLNDTVAFFIQHKVLIYSFIYAVLFDAAPYILEKLFQMNMQDIPSPIPELAGVLYILCILVVFAYITAFRFKYRNWRLF